MKYKSLRTQILGIVVSLTLILLIAVNIYNYQERKKILYNISIEKLLVLTKIMRNFEKKQLNLYRGRINTIQNDTNILRYIEENKPLALKKYISKVRNAFKTATPDLEHIHIYNKNAQYIYDIDKIKDSLSSPIDNQVLQEVIKTKKLQTGYVIFDTTNYFYSIIAPIFKNNQIIAYIEFGIKADNQFKLASKAGRYKYALYLNDKLDNANKDKREIGTLVTANYGMFEDLQIDQNFIYKYANKNKIFTYNDRDFLFHQYDIEKSFQKNFAQVLMASNVTKYTEDNENQTIITVVASLLILSFTYISIYLLITKLINKLIEDEKKLSYQQKQMQVIIDNNDNLITLFKGNELILANKPFLSFFNFDKLEQFKEKHSSLAELFIEDDDTFIPKEKSNNLSWILQIKSLQEKEKVVAFQHNTYGLNYFNVQISVVPNQKDSFVVVFSNITTMFKQSQKDQYMARHDVLTGIFNRQSFNEAISYDILQQLSHSHNSSLLMFDLDFFKKVNDTYGHQVGDDVLVLFSQTITENIRTNDIFARWGGEEFVLLLVGIPEETAIVIANNLREKIANTNFSSAGKITCSVGLSTYILDDTVESWFTRVDEALYKAKANGRNRVEVL
jgi:diguanylate cyclase (GGDEF)-like protein